MRLHAVLAAFAWRNSARTASITGKGRSTAQCGLAPGKKFLCSKFNNFYKQLLLLIFYGLVAQLGEASEHSLRFVQIERQPSKL